jgi:hypothetical protein
MNKTFSISTTENGVNNKVNSVFPRGYKFFFAICYLLLAHCSLLLASDFGLILDQSAGFSGNGDENTFAYSGLIVPRFSSYWGNDNSFYISAGARLDYDNKEVTFVPELLRTEAFFGFGSFAITLGRIFYSDPLGYIAKGLFDGARLSYDTALGTFGAGAWYTGLLYKKRSDIIMTTKEEESYNAKVTYADFASGNFAASYFAPRRLFASLDFEHLSLFDLLIVNAALLGQFDLTGEGLHSQYITGKVSVPYNVFLFDIGGCFEIIQGKGEGGAAFSSDLGVIWELPFSLPSRLSFLARFTSGEKGSTKAFLPLTAKSQGFVLKTNHTATTLFSLDYGVRLHPACSLSLSSVYFIRNDRQSLAGFDKDGALLGNEFKGKLIWSPLSDVRLDFGAGVFIPRMGNAAPEAKNLWRMELTAIIAVY